MLESDQTVTGDLNRKKLLRLEKAIEKKRTRICIQAGSSEVDQSLSLGSLTFSPVLAPSDYHLFRSIKNSHWNTSHIRTEENCIDAFSE